MSLGKKFLKKPIKILSIIIAFILIIVIIFTIIHPISMPNKLVEKYLFLQINKGTSMEDAIKEIEDKWEIKRINYDYGIYFTENGQPNEINLETKKDLVGSKYIYARLGEYTTIFDCFVYAYFIFDENDKLIKIAVTRDWDAM
jgi:uncharacterized protein YxeA